MEHVTGPILGWYIAAFCVNTPEGAFAYAKITATRPASIWDGTPALRWVSYGPADIDYMGMVIVIDKAKTVCADQHTSDAATDVALRGEDMPPRPQWVPLRPGIFRVEAGWAGAFTRATAEGAMPGGTRVVKERSDPKDMTPTGTPGIVLGSVRHPEVQGGAIMYFIAWAAAPRIAVACMDWKLRLAE